RDRIDIAAARRIELDAVGRESRGHRSEHRVGDRERAEQERPAACAQRVAPDLEHPAGIGQRLRSVTLAVPIRAHVPHHRPARPPGTPACLPAPAARDRARCAGWAGQSWAGGALSFRYSQIAIESQITPPSWWSTGMRPAGVTAATSARVVGRSSRITLVSNA